MNLTVFASGKNVFTNCECIKGYAFKMAGTRDSYALFAPETAIFAACGDNNVHFDFQSLSPISIAC